MTQKEFLQRWAYETVEPTGERREDYRNARLCYAVAVLTWCQAGGKGKQPKFENFLPDWWEERVQGEREKHQIILMSLGLTEGLKLLEEREKWQEQ